MRGIAASKGILNAGLLLFLINHLTFASDLIEPTRTLNGPIEKAGELSVFSEPPQLEVKLDGTQIGETPVVDKKVAPCMHVIRVRDSETGIYVAPGKSTKLSWLKGVFIEIPVAIKEARKQQSEEKKEIPQIKMSEQPDKKKEKPDPLYWPWNPRGSIY